MSLTHTQVPSCLPITRSENQNTEQLVLHGHTPTIQMPNLSERLLVGYHTGTGQISPLPKKLFLAGYKEDQIYEIGGPSWEAGYKTVWKAYLAGELSLLSFLEE